jgi:putative membrane protein
VCRPPEALKAYPSANPGRAEHRPSSRLNVFGIGFAWVAARMPAFSISSPRPFRLRVVVAALALVPRAAWAHPGTPVLEPHDFWRAWTPAPAVLLGLLLAAWLYARGLGGLWSRGGRGRVVTPARAWCFGGSLLALFVALVSPVDAAGEALFSAHMVQHLLLMMVAAPLMALGEPLLVMLWALPVAWRRVVGRRWRRAYRLRALWATVTVPGVAWVLHVSALWGWHVPTLYERALREQGIHVVEHASFFATALLFWWLLARQHGRRMGIGAALAYLFGAALQGTLLGATLTFARRPWYPSHYGTTAGWGLSALEDQQLAGLLMWIPAGVAYLVPLLPLLMRALGERDTGAVDSFLPVRVNGQSPTSSFSSRP